MTPRDIQAVLAWSALPHVGERTLVALLQHAREARQSLADLWSAPLDDLARLVRLHPRTVAARQNDGDARWERAGQDAATLRRWGVDLLLLGEPEYPAALEECARRSGRSWPVLYAYGALGLLEEPRVAFANSRSVSHAGLSITEVVADALARRDVALVASTSKEHYQAAAVAAKRHAGASIMVLDRGLAEAFPAGLEREPIASARVWDTAFDPDVQLILSPFAWKERWTPRAGPKRDALVMDLAHVIVAVEVGAEGNMERECRAAARQGKPVLVLDRGADSPEGTRSLWEEAGAVRIPWQGAEPAAAEVLRALPGDDPAGGETQESGGWLRDVGHFLARACAALRDRPLRSPSVGATPAGSPLGRVARSWSASPEPATSGFDCLMADLSAGGSPTRCAQLLSRVAPGGGLLAAVVPATWIEGQEHAAARAAWLQEARLRLAARLPQSPWGDERLGIVILERGGSAGPEALVFDYREAGAGRFHLRRYLQEVLAAVAAAA